MPTKTSRTFIGWQEQSGLDALPPATSDSDGQRQYHTRTERRVPELIPVLGSQPAGDRSQKHGGKPPLLFARPAVTSPAAEHHRSVAGTKLYCLVNGDRGMGTSGNLTQVRWAQASCLMMMMMI